jgi:hypothetical protein
MPDLDNELIDKVWRDCCAGTAKMTPKDIFLFGVGVGVGMVTELQE